MTTYVSCRKCVPVKTPIYQNTHENPDQFLFMYDKLPPGTWIFRGGNRYYCPHTTTVARSSSQPWYSDISVKMNAKQGREDIR